MRLFFVISLMVAVGYVAYMGIEAIARTSFILSMLCLAGVLLIGIGVVKDFEWLNINMTFDTGDNLIKEIFEYVSQSNEIAVLVLLLPHIKKGAAKLSLSFVTANAVLTMAGLPDGSWHAWKLCAAIAIPSLHCDRLYRYSYV